MPIIVPAPAPTPSARPSGTWPALTITRGSASVELTQAHGWTILPGVQGLDDPPPTLIEIEPAIGDGTFITDARYAAREIFLPLNYAATSTATLRSTLRNLAALCDIKAGDVTLTLAHDDGSRRSIEGRLSQPLAPNALESGEGALWRQLGLSLRCPDPLWMADEDSLTFSLGSPPAFLSSTFLPMQLADSQVAGEVTLTNNGDAAAYAVWTITGPCDDLEVAAGSTTFSVPDGLLDSETLVIDAQRGVKTCEVNGASAWGRLAAGATISTLAAGDTGITVTATGADADTTVSLTWAERWLTAW